jgi:adenylate kinase
MEHKINIISKWLGSGSINFFGLPFSGKDTQGRILADIFGGVVISGGDVLRHNKDNQRLQQLLATGEIIPTDLFEEIVIPYLSNPEFQNKPLMLSEVGRLEGEQIVTMRAATISKHPTKAVVFLRLSEEEVYRRFEKAKQEQDRGERTDDHREVLRIRLEKYQEKVVPVINWYRDKKLLLEVDGTLKLEEVTDEIINSLARSASTSNI